MRTKTILIATIVLLAFFTSCQKDTPSNTETSLEPQETFSFTGEWYCPSIEWLSETNVPFTSVGDFIGYQCCSSLYKTIRFIDGGSMVEHWQGCFVWDQKSINSETGGLRNPDTVYFSVNDDSTSINLYVKTQDFLRTVPMRMVSLTEMEIDGEVYLRPQQNPTAMVSLPARNWYYDFSNNGFYFKGSAGRGQLDLNNPTFEWRNGKLWVIYNMIKCQVVRPYADYNAMAEKPHGLFNCAGADTSFEEKMIDYNGVTRMANVQNNGGQWCDTICEYAFAGCKELEEVVLGMQTIKPYAFHGCSLRGVFLWFVPQSIASTAFDDWQYEHTAVHVSKHHPEILQTAPWDRFSHAYADLERP